MKLTIAKNLRTPVIPLVALFIIGYLNIINRCADGYCYTYGWPWVAYYGWSDAGFTLGGVPNYPHLEWLPALGNLLVAGTVLVLAWVAHRRLWRAAG